MKSEIEISPYEWETIESYLDQILVLKEESFLSEKMNQIPNINEKIAYVKQVREEIEDSIRHSKIKEFHNHISDEKDSEIKIPARKRIKSSAIWYSAAAMLLVLFGIFWMMDKGNSSEKIFAENFKPDIGLPLKMGAENSYGFYEGMVDYKQENYKEAILKWNVLLKKNPENDTLNYFLGVAHLALGEADSSLEYLQNQELFRDGMFKEDAAYYAALAKIKKGKLEEAKVLLTKNVSERNEKLLYVLKNL